MDGLSKKLMIMVFLDEVGARIRPLRNNNACITGYSTEDCGKVLLFQKSSTQNENYSTHGFFHEQSKEQEKQNVAELLQSCFDFDYKHGRDFGKEAPAPSYFRELDGKLRRRIQSRQRNLSKRSYNRMSDIEHFDHARRIEKLFANPGI